MIDVYKKIPGHRLQIYKYNEMTLKYFAGVSTIKYVHASVSLHQKTTQVHIDSEFLI